MTQKISRSFGELSDVVQVQKKFLKKEVNFMSANYSDIRELLQQRADYQTRLNLMPYDGNPEIKERGDSKYLYIRKRVAGKLTPTYIDVYSDELYQILLRNARESKELKK